MGSSNRRSGKSIEQHSRKTLRKGITFFAATCVIATVGYVLAGWDWLDAIYMVTITIFGVGYGEVQPIEAPMLKLFTMGVIFAGCSSLVYVIGGIVQMLAEGEVERMLGIRTRSREIGQLSDHTIICGYGRVGQMLALELSNHGESLVVLDRNPDRVQLAIEDGFLALEGDAVNDDVLHRVGLFRARTLATVLPDDATNVFITLTARDLSDNIQIISRAESPCTERKLIRSGATSVVMPAAISAVRIAQLVSSPVSVPDALPERRYRMLDSARADESAEHTVDQLLEEEVAALENDTMDDVPVETAQKLQTEIAELAHLASDLTRTVARRHHEHLAAGQPTIGQA